MKDFEKIIALDNPVEAELIDSILTEQQIPHQLKCYHDLAYDGIFQLQQGWGSVLAQPVHREIIIKIVEEVRAAAGEIELEERPDDSAGETEV